MEHILDLLRFMAMVTRDLTTATVKGPYGSQSLSCKVSILFANSWIPAVLVTWYMYPQTIASCSIFLQSSQLANLFQHASQQFNYVSRCVLAHY